MVDYSNFCGRSSIIDFIDMRDETNIDYWKRVVDSPSPVFKQLFEEEETFLQENIRENAHVLDIGCGDGRDAQAILSKTKNITCVDYDPLAIEFVQKRFADIEGFSAQQADVRSLPFADNTFDAAVLMLTFVNFADFKIEALNEMRRVITKDGRIIISVYSDKAFAERVRMYESVGAPIKEKRPYDGLVVFDWNGANFSEQFHLADIDKIASECHLEIDVIKNVRGIAYIMSLAKA